MIRKVLAGLFPFFYALQVLAVGYLLRDSVSEPVWLLLMFLWAAVSAIPLSRFFLRL
ncbi:MAG: hypothetical protein LC790_11480 [Actinobacteria bacterium]|nr:hypothetical protein [Actinomycetota bacterium]